MDNPLDLDAIRHRYDTLTATAGPDALLPACWSAADVPALVAEVERLRARIDAALADRLDHGAQGNGYAQLVDRMRQKLKGTYRGSQTEGADQ